MSGCPFRHLWPGSAASPHPRQQEDQATEPAGEATLGVAEAPEECPLSRQRAHPADQPAQVGAATAPPAAPAAAGSLEPPTPGSAEQGGPAAGQCPFLAGVGSVKLEQAREPEPGPQPAAAAGPSDGSQTAAAAAAAPPPAVCPLGFGSGQQPKLGEFHCLICRSLYHDCVRTSCGHRYCSGCLRGCRDCPICGADIEGVQPDEETQALVDRYIDAHAGNHTIWELEGSGGQEVDGMAGERSRAAFLLQLGLRAIAAGNTGSARHRFQLCQQDLQQQLGAAQQQQQQQGSMHTEEASLQCRLGAVSGCLGDCCRAEGDAAGTLRHYQESVALLQAAGEDPEAQQALSVALNKVGELHHMQGDLAAAAEHYSQALQLRRALLSATQRQWQPQDEQHKPANRTGGDTEPATESRSSTAAAAAAAAAVAAVAAAAAEGDEACCSAALDLAASCLKLSGAQRGLGAAHEAQSLLSEAAALLEGLEQAGAVRRQPARLQGKHASLLQFASMMQQAADAEAS